MSSINSWIRGLKPIVIYSDRFLDRISILMVIGGISLFPFVILREKYNSSDWWKKRAKKTINHESIHFQQQLELGVLPFYILYISEWIIKLPFYGAKAYENISFEREAYGHASDMKYLKNRVRYSWIKLVLKRK